MSGLPAPSLGALYDPGRAPGKSPTGGGVAEAGNPFAHAARAFTWRRGKR